MGILILLFVGMGISAAGMYWAHGAKVDEKNFLSKPIWKLQKLMDERSKDRGDIQKTVS